MSKLTRAKARKRLDEASRKIIMVFLDYPDLSAADLKKINDMHRQLRQMVMRLK